MHFTGAPYANFAFDCASYEKAMRLINRVMGERAKFMHFCVHGYNTAMACGFNKQARDRAEV
jgi:hypothetical protein